MSFHRGSSDTEAIDRDIQLFVSKYGKSELKNVAKMHFKNLDKYREWYNVIDWRMIMKLKNSFFFTIREDVKDEDSVSGNLLVKAG